MKYSFKPGLKKMISFEGFDIRFILLICLLVTLPAFEALKNLFSFLFVLSWLIIAKKENYWGGKWRVIDSIFLLWILGDIFVSINAIITHQYPGSGFRDIIRFVLIAWVLSRIRFSNEKLTQSAIFALVATVFTLIYSYFIGHGELKELYSVGHINHTAIYLVISYTISLALLIFNFNNLRNYQKIILVVTTIVFFLTTIDAGSQAAIGLLILITIFDIIFVLIRFKKLFLVFITFSIIFCVGILSSKHPKYTVALILAYQTSQFESFKLTMDDNVRKKIRNFSYHAFRTNPIFGVGFGNFGKIEIDDIKDSILKKNKVFDNSLYLSSSHTHHLFYNYLVSGGIFLFSILLWFWFYIFWILGKHIVLNNFKLYRVNFPENEWIVLSGIGVVLINIGIGFVNTTLHHEHAILSMFVIGLLIAQFRVTESINEFSN